MPQSGASAATVSVVRRGSRRSDPDEATMKSDQGRQWPAVVLPSYYPSPKAAEIKHEVRVHLRCCGGHNDWQPRHVITTDDYAAFTLGGHDGPVRDIIYYSDIVECHEFEHDDPLAFLTWPVATENLSAVASPQNPIPADPIAIHSDSLHHPPSAKYLTTSDFRETLSSLSANPGRCVTIRTHSVA